MRKRIEFDFNKWGQDGIEVEYKEYNIITLHSHPNAKSNTFYGISEMGFFDAKREQLVMYEDKKPREIWINEYPFEYRAFYISEKEAIEDTQEHFLKRSKFIEVL